MRFTPVPPIYVQTEGSEARKKPAIDRYTRPLWEYWYHVVLFDEIVLTPCFFFFFHITVPPPPDQHAAMLGCAGPLSGVTDG